MALASNRLKNGEAGNMKLEGQRDGRISSALTAFAPNANLRARRYLGGTVSDICWKRARRALGLANLLRANRCLRPLSPFPNVVSSNIFQYLIRVQRSGVKLQRSPAAYVGL